MRRFFVLSLAAFSGLAASVHAANFAGSVIAYTPGTTVGIYTNAPAAVGSPSPLTGENASATPSFGVNTLNPFSPAYQTDEIVRVGEGGSLTLKLSLPVAVGAGPELGLVENVSLIDPAYPSGTTTTPAATFGEDSAFVEVSSDGITYVGLTGGAATSVLFNLPASYYLNGGAFDTDAPANPVLADFGKPFAPSNGLAAFDGKASYADVLSVLNGSGGGTWFDASASGLSLINFVRFTVPNDNDDATSNSLEVDALLSNSALVVPEPTMLGIVGLAAITIVRRRK